MGISERTGKKKKYLQVLDYCFFYRNIELFKIVFGILNVLRFWFVNLCYRSDCSKIDGKKIPVTKAKK